MVLGRACPAFQGGKIPYRMRILSTLWAKTILLVQRLQPDSLQAHRHSIELCVPRNNVVRTLTVNIDDK